MANTHRNIDADELYKYSLKYVDECIEAVKEIATNSGKVLDVKERHLPTIDYFLRHWLRRNHPDFWNLMIKERQWYNAKKKEDHPLFHTIKNITSDLHALSKDIVANEGKGIFYAKNALGMTDKNQVNLKTDATPFNPFDVDVPGDNSTS